MQHAACNMHTRHHNDVRHAILQHFPGDPLRHSSEPMHKQRSLSRAHATVPPGRDRVASSPPTAHASRRCHWPSATG